MSDFDDFKMINPIAVTKRIKEFLYRKQFHRLNWHDRRMQISKRHGVFSVKSGDLMQSTDDCVSLRCQINDFDCNSGSCVGH